jgi:ribA/ribD-fused uncharacterized protein
MTTMVSTVADLTRLIEQGGPVDFLFFWGHQPQRDGSVGPGSLSQWWPARFTAGGLEFATAEHYMMWRKATLFDDNEVAQQVLTTDDPREAKAFGRQVHGFDDETWRAHRFDIVVAASVAKFGQHDDLREYLLGTGEQVLVEASPRDRVWGIGLSASNERARQPSQWRGLNLLGFALMRARTMLRAGSG